MSKLIVRKISTVVEEIFHEGGPVANVPMRRVAAIAIVKNPFAGKYVEDIQWFMDVLRPLGLEMATKLVDAMGDASLIEGYGKGSLVGAGGELEHGALWHAPGGYAMRELIGGSKAIVPSAKKVGGVGARLDVPITHINASYVRSHFDSMEVGMNDSPRTDEMLLALVVTSGARVHARSGGLDSKDIVGKDGLK